MIINQFKLFDNKEQPGKLKGSFLGFISMINDETATDSSSSPHNGFFLWSLCVL